MFYGHLIYEKIEAKKYIKIYAKAAWIMQITR